MTTVMGSVNKKPIKLIIILANRTPTKNTEYGMKLKQIVECIGGKIAELFLSIREDFEFRGFEIAYHQCYIANFRQKILEVNRQRQDIILGFLVGNYPQFTSFNNTLQNYFVIPDRIMQILPDNLKHEETWSAVTKNKMGEMMCRLAHEIFHSLGAFHCDTGIMSGYTDLFAGASKNVQDVKLLDLTDKKTVTIICESLSIITTLSPQRNLKFNSVNGRLTYDANQSIAAVFFVYQEKYTWCFREYSFLDSCKRFNGFAPAEWDGFVVVHFCGHIFYYSKTDVLTTKRCSKMLVF